jgi:hypothetical protein
MFRSLPKSRTAIEKAAGLSPLELEVFNMHVTAAFLRPDLYSSAKDYFHKEQNSIVFEFMTVEIDVALITLVFHPNGTMAILDFFITAELIPAQEHRGTMM